MQPLEAFEKGLVLLQPVLGRAGFVFVGAAARKGSGGAFASGDFVRGDRRLELHFRYSLGLVTYHVREHMLSHEAYMRALGVPPTDNQYPGYSNDPLDGFRHLAADLTQFGTEFLYGDAAVLLEHAPHDTHQREVDWRKEKAGYEGDDERRREAKKLFRQGDYARVVEILTSLHYPEFLTTSEQRTLEIARTRAG
jgi:hypothetical protein